MTGSELKKAIKTVDFKLPSSRTAIKLYFSLLATLIKSNGMLKSINGLSLSLMTDDFTTMIKMTLKINLEMT